MTLKQKTVNGLLWSFIENFSKQGITFIVGIILARLLTPEEFGLIGMITIFIAISTSVINSGFSQALIRKKDCTDTDYSTVFYFNLLVGVVLFAILFFAAPLIAGFFNEPQLTKLVKVLASVLVIDAFTIIQRTKLTKRIDFKLQTKISVIADIVSGVAGIAMAYTGFGVWSLVARQIIQRALNALLLWVWNRWIPLLVFSKESFKELFSFGSRLLVSGLIDTAYRNIYLLVIGKFFSAAELGYFTRSEQFQKLPSQNINAVIQRVTYPVLSSMQDDKSRLKNNYQKLIRSTMLITFVLMLGMAAVAEPMIITLIGEKWRPSIIYLQMLSFVGMMYPLHALNLNMLKVSGRSDIILKLEIIKKILAVPTIVIGVIWGIKIMIAGMMVNTLIAYYLNSYWSGRFIGYSFKQQVTDILPSFSLALTMAVAVYLLGLILPFSMLLKLILQIGAGAAIVFLFCELTQFKDYIFVKNLIVEKIKEFKETRKKR